MSGLNNNMFAKKASLITNKSGIPTVPDVILPTAGWGLSLNKTYELEQRQADEAILKCKQSVGQRRRTQCLYFFLFHDFGYYYYSLK